MQGSVVLHFIDYVRTGLEFEVTGNADLEGILRRLLSLNQSIQDGKSPLYFDCDSQSGGGPGSMVGTT